MHRKIVKRAFAERTSVGWFILICTAAVAAYANSFRTGLVFDASTLILKDPRLTAVSWHNLHLIFTQDYWYPAMVNGLFRPVTTLSYLFHYSVLGSGANPMSYHCINLLLHLLNIKLVHLLAFRTFHYAPPALAAAAIWGLHPIATEVVTNIAGRPDLLSAACVLGGLLCYANSSEASGRRQWLWRFSLMAVAVAGVFSKENAVVLPAVMLIYDAAFGSLAGWRKRAWDYVAVVPSVVLLFIVRARLFAGLPAMKIAYLDNPLVEADFWTARLTAVKVIGKYLGRLIYPATLSADYSFGEIPLADWGDWEAWATLVVCILAVALAAISFRRSRTVFFFIAFFFITLLPTSNLIMIIGTVMAERFLYLPSVGFAGLVVTAIWWAATRIGRPRLAPAAILLIALAFAARTYARNFDWLDNTTLCEATVKASPRSFKAHWTLAAALSHTYPMGTHLDEEVSEAAEALRILEKLPDERSSGLPYADAGAFYRMQGDYLASSESASWYRKSLKTLLRGLRIDQAVDAEINRLEMRRGKREFAAPKSSVPDLYVQLGITYQRLQQPEKALEMLEDGRRRRPDHAELYERLAEAHETTGKLDKAAITALEGLTIAPKRAETARQVFRVYRKLASPCALDVQGLHKDCPLVFGHLCSGYRELDRLFRGARKEDLAAEFRKAAIVSGCP